MSTIKVKLCGFTQQDSLETAIDCGCDFIGFIFHEKSPRNISFKEARHLGSIIPDNIAKVAVVVDADNDFLHKIADSLNPDILQFHGNESIQYIKNFKEKFPDQAVIKAFAADTEKDIANSLKYHEVCDYFLYDSKTSNGFGGSGISFDWKIFNKKTPNKNWFLSGGLNIENIEDAILTSQAPMVDISSGIEESRGHKSNKMIQELMQKIKSLQC